MTTVLITGSNRGLGLEWVRQYAAEGWRVFATCRQPREARDLEGMAAERGNISIHPLDVTRSTEINALAVELVKEPIDVLINNAGVYLEKYMEIGLNSIRYEDWEYTFRVNTLGAVRVTEAFQEHVSRSEKRLIVVISTQMASIADIAAPGAYYYRSTKAALNAAMKGITHELKPKGIGVLIMHPGWARTKMGGEGTSLLPPESVRGMRALIENFTLEKTGRFFRYDGVELPW